MVDPSQRKAIFLDAVEKYQPDQWSSLLDSRCGSNLDLRTQVESLLRAHQESREELNGSSAFFRQTKELDSEIDRLKASELCNISKVGPFTVEQLIGRGGIGNVFLARDENLDRPVALKVPRIEVLGNLKLQERFMKEAQIAASLRHPGLVEIYEYGTSGRFCFLASRWCAGGDLAAWLASHPGSHPPHMVASFVHQLCLAVAHCHQADVLHLDIKPGNIMLESELVSQGESPQHPGNPLLTDFGLAQVIQDSLIATGTSSLMGTPLYMAPEQVECRERDFGPHTDVYAIGVILFEMLAGHRPFDGETPMEVFDQIRGGEGTLLVSKLNVPESLRKICEVCLQKRVEDRYASAEDLAEDLQHFLHHRPIVAEPPTRLRRLGYWLADPERMRQAGLTMLTIQVTGVLSVFLLIGLLFLGAAGPFKSDPWEQVFQYLPLLILINIPSIVLSIQAIARRRWAIFAGLAMSISYVIAPTLMLLGITDSLVFYQGFPAAAFIGTLAHSAFATVQFLAFALAVPAAIGRGK